MDVREQVRVDLERQARCGYPEVVYGPGKQNEAIIHVFAQQQSAGQSSLATRVTPEQAAAVCEKFPQTIYNILARTIRLNISQADDSETDSPSPTVGIIAAGTSDLPVAEEAAETLRWMGFEPTMFIDVGVAGPQRLLQVVPDIQKCNVVIVVAGMEGALPSVVAGWVSCPVVAVPTSVGYGFSFEGLSAFLSMVNSCASNVAVVNIDAGFKAAYFAGMILQQTLRTAHAIKRID